MESIIMEVLFTTISQAILIGLGSGVLTFLVGISIMALSIAAAERLVKSVPSTFKTGMKYILGRLEVF
jgi:hypothetical protein